MTKYCDEAIELAKEYATEFEKYGDTIPSNQGLALVLKVRRETVQEWGRDPRKPEFRDILDEIQARQHQILINKGLKGEYNSHITKLVLGKHGYHDKVDNQHTGDFNVTIDSKDADTL